jgi:RNA recognition motif-containing protein
LLPFRTREKGNAIDGKLQIRNLPTDTTEAELSELFAGFGDVLDARIVRDVSSGMSKGYGFVTMGAMSGADAAVSRLDGYALHGFVLKVRLAKIRTVRGGFAPNGMSPQEGREQ